MPRDLLAEKKTLESMPKLSREPDPISSPEPEGQSSLVPHRSSNIAQEDRLRQMGVRPYSSLLSVEDLDDCDWLEHAAFDPVEAASREKVRSVNISAASLFKSLHFSRFPLSSTTAIGLCQASKNARFSTIHVTRPMGTAFYLVICTLSPIMSHTCIY